MKFIFSFLLTLVSLTIFCQKDNYEVAKKEFENFIFSSDAIKIQNIKNRKFEKIPDIQEYNHPITRSLDFDFKRKHLRVETHVFCYSYSTRKRSQNTFILLRRERRWKNY